MSYWVNDIVKHRKINVAGDNARFLVSMYDATSQGNYATASGGKLIHDAEQLSHLLVQGKLPPALWSVVADYISLATSNTAAGMNFFILQGAADNS